MISNTVSILYMYVAVLIGMAYFTLLERKILAAMQLRKGPNKVGLEAVLQPIADAIKLFSKVGSAPMSSNKFTFLLCPTLKLTLSLMLWTIVPNPELNLHFSCNMIFFLCISSSMVYMIIGMGWASNSKYALLGALRGFAQMVSYEVTMGLMMIAILIPINSLDTDWIFKNSGFAMALFSPPLLYIWFIIMLAETNRAPFDFTEAESELVSGFNIEYGGTPFAFIFMAEYLSIMAVCFITANMLMQKFTMPIISYFAMVIQGVALMIMFILIRGTMPRMRYDQLMDLTWKYFLAASLFYISLNTLVYLMFEMMYKVK